MNKINIPLNHLPIGKTAKVVSLQPSANIHRRLQDIGLVEGTSVTALQKSPSDDPTAYFIRGAVIAIRSEDASLVFVEPIQHEFNEIGQN